MLNRLCAIIIQLVLILSIEDKQANKLEANLVWQLTITHLSIIVYIFIFSVVSMSQFSEFISNA